MAEVANSTFHSTRSSSANSRRSGAFDLNSWQGLTELLMAARESGMDTEQYNHFRDIVLRYAQSGGDTELRAQIESTMRSLKVGETDTADEVPSSQKTETQNAPHEKDEAKAQAAQVPTGAQVPTEAQAPKQTSAPDKTSETSTEQRPQPLGSARPKPSFKNVEKQPTSAVAAEPPVSNAKSRATQDTNEDRSEATPPKAASPNADKDAGTPQSSTPQTEEKSQQAVNADAPPQKTERVSAVDSGGKTAGEHRERIAEIKRLVAEQVGNPMTLIDNGNPAGRTYMNALLNAMRKLGGGHAGELDAAMEALESAYAEILNVTSTPPTDATRKTAPSSADAVAQTEETVAPEQTQTPVAADTVQSDIEKSAPQSAKPPQDTETVENETKAAPEVVQTKRPTENAHAIPSLADVSRTKPQSDTEGQQPEKPSNAANSTVVPPNAQTATDAAREETKQPAAPEKHSLRDLTNALRSERQASAQKASSAPEPEAKQTDVTTAAPEQPAARAPESETASEPKADLAKPSETAAPHTEKTEIPRSVEQRDLTAPEVTAGLEQLLNEWQLFKSSGIFGTGPSGSEHPLYQTLKELPMKEVLDGRFDKSSPEIIRSIKDYTNAWRHEQGVTYVQSETFEHYLRRVVQRILKRQQH